MKRIIFCLFLTTVLLTSCFSGDSGNDTEKTWETDTSDSQVETTAEDKETDTESQDTYDPVTDTENEDVYNDVTDTEGEDSSNDEEDKLGSFIEKMTLEEKVGQLFLARNPKNRESGIELIKEKKVGGIIFFGSDFKRSDPKSFRSLISEYNEVSDIPLLTAVDEEGGTVCRASLYPKFRSERFASPAELYEAGGLERVLEDTREKTEFLLDLGLNFNLAPVADISTDEGDFIYKRALGRGRDEVAEYISTVVSEMNKGGILSALKHFPGYGNNEDTHTGIAYDKRSIESLWENDLVPFKRGIEAGAPVVMVSHNVILSIDGERPASLSPEVISLLRDEMGFCGVIMTDDLSMDAIGDFTESGEAAVLAVMAGADLLCCSDTERQYEAVIQAVYEGRISEERIELSVRRILEAKEKIGIFSVEDMP